MKQWSWVLLLWFSDLGLDSPRRPGQQGCESRWLRKPAAPSHFQASVALLVSRGNWTWTALTWRHLQHRILGLEAEMSSRRLSPVWDARACVLWLIQPREHPLLEEQTVKTPVRAIDKSWTCRGRESMSHPEPDTHCRSPACGAR